MPRAGRSSIESVGGEIRRSRRGAPHSNAFAVSSQLRRDTDVLGNDRLADSQKGMALAALDLIASANDFESACGFLFSRIVQPKLSRWACTN